MTHLPASALLFDCDGVLVDTTQTLRRSCTPWATDLALDSVRIVAKAAQDAGPADNLTRELTVSHAVEAIPGARALVQQVPARNWAVITSGSADEAMTRLQWAGFAIPSVLITGNDVYRHKPALDGYRRAAELLGIDPGAAVVLEDSRRGVVAARAAGIAAVVGVGPAASYIGADVVVHDLTAMRWSSNILYVPD